MAVAPRSEHNLRFILIALALFSVGIVLRYQSGWYRLPEQAEVPAQPTESNTQEQLPPGLRETVFKFYHSIDRGYYTEAYQISLESTWQERSPDTFVRTGLTTLEEFVSALTWEWRVNGTDLTIVEMDLRRISRLEADRLVPSERPELYSLASLPPGAEVEDIYQVEIGGIVIERCSTWEWHKKVLVAKLDTGEWKVLLLGFPDARSTRVDVWFLDQNPFANRQILQEKK